MKNSLPKYWVVKKSTDPRFKKAVIKYLNEICNQWTGTDNDYYGFDGNSSYNGTNAWTNVKSFQNSPTLLSLDEFCQMVETPQTINTFKFC